MQTSQKLRSILRTYVALAACTLVTATSSGVIAASTPVPRRASSYVQAATGSIYWQDQQNDQWLHRDTAEISLGHQFGSWLDTNLTWSVRTDITTSLGMDTRLSLLRLGPASMGLRLQGSAGTGLESDIWVFRSIAAGPEFGITVANRNLSLWGIAGLREKSAWHFNSLNAPFAEAGVTLQPKAGVSGIIVGGSYVATESPVNNGFEGSWSGQVGYRKAL